MKDIEKLFVYRENSVYEAMNVIQRGKVEMALLVDEDRRLIATITDGDIRRALLIGLDTNDCAERLLENRIHSNNKPVFEAVGTPPDELLKIMRQKTLRHIPLIDEDGRVVELAWISELIEEVGMPLSAVVMAGGFGTRLYPLTEDVPKPMLPVGDQPLLERIIEQLQQSGIERVHLTTHYKKDIIAEHFGDGSKFGLEIRYLEEEQPLGTAGALCLLEAPTEPLLVINGDILSQVNFSAMLNFHREHEADMTVAVRQHESPIPFGVVEVDGIKVTGITEKPVITHFVNAGVYLLDPVVCGFIPKDQTYDMTDLITRALAEGKRVICFPVHEYWLDIGELTDYEQAQIDIKDGKD